MSLQNVDALPDREAAAKLPFDIKQIEQNVVWELDTWKKNEEAKFKILMKEKEFEYLQQLSSEWKAKELQREKAFKQQFAQMQTIENKMKVKASELQKREYRILQLEEELKLKLSETARVVKQKDEEQGALIKKYKDERLNQEKEKTNLNLKLADSQAQIQKLQEDLIKLRNDMASSPIALVKGELQKRQQEIVDLKKEIDKINQIKEQYKHYYEKVLEEVLKQKKINEELKQSSQQLTHSELHKLKEELDDLRRQTMSKKEKENVNSVNHSTHENPFKHDLLENVDTFQLKPPQIIVHNQRLASRNPEPRSNDLQRLLQERAYLTLSGEYLEDDPLIQELTRHIQELGGE